MKTLKTILFVLFLFGNSILQPLSANDSIQYVLPTEEEIYNFIELVIKEQKLNKSFGLQLKVDNYINTKKTIPFY